MRRGRGGRPFTTAADDEMEGDRGTKTLTLFLLSDSLSPTRLPSPPPIRDFFFFFTGGIIFFGGSAFLIRQSCVRLLLWNATLVSV